MGDGQLIPLPAAAVDGVMSIGSLEHYDDPLWACANWLGCSNRLGKACILLPNMFGLMGNIRHVRRTGEVFDDSQPLQRYGTRASWQTMLEMGGLTVERVVPWGEVSCPRTGHDWIVVAVAAPESFARRRRRGHAGQFGQSLYLPLPSPSLPRTPAYYPMLPWS